MTYTHIYNLILLTEMVLACMYFGLTDIISRVLYGCEGQLLSGHELTFLKA